MTKSFLSVALMAMSFNTISAQSFSTGSTTTSDVF